MKTLSLMLLSVTLLAAQTATAAYEDKLTGEIFCQFTKPGLEDHSLVIQSKNGKGKFVLSNTAGIITTKKIKVSQGQICSSYGFSCGEVIRIIPVFNKPVDTSDYFTLQFAETLENDTFTLLPEYSSSAYIPLKINGKFSTVNGKMSCAGTMAAK